MNALVFFPWFKVKKEITAGDFRLVPYERGRLPAGAGNDTQVTIDNLLESYVENGKFPINHATLLRLRNKEITDDLEEETDTVFVFSELLAISGLSKRRFFSLAACEYCNRDIYRMVVLRFTDSSHGSTRESRRRDSSTTTHTSRDSLQIHKPDHVVHPINGEPDIPLLSALLKSQVKCDPDKWASIFEAVSCFNLANTDSDYVSIQDEAVLLTSAFERLLDCNGNEDSLAERFTTTLTPREDKHPSVCSSLTTRKLEGKFRSSTCIRNVWIRDFFRLRNNLAHGRLSPGYPSIWNINDHLLFASFIFPLLLKYKLSELDFYTFSDEDKLYVDVFEALTCEEHCMPYDDENEHKEDVWNRIISDEMILRLVERNDEETS